MDLLSSIWNFKFALNLIKDFETLNVPRKNFKGPLDLKLVPGIVFNDHSTQIWTCAVFQRTLRHLTGPKIIPKDLPTPNSSLKKF